MNPQMNPQMNSQMNHQTNPQMNNQMSQSLNQSGGSRLPSLSSLPINNMTNQQYMMNQPYRMPSIFGQNPGYGMNQMGMPFQSQANNVFQGGRMINPNYMNGMNPYQQNMQMMQYPMSNQYYQGPGQMNRPGMMGFNPNMPNFNPGMMGMMNRPMGMMNNPYGMMPPGQNMNPMVRGMPINQNMMNRNQAKIGDMVQGDQYVPGSLEEHAISAITNTDYKYNDADLLDANYDTNDKGEVINPGKFWPVIQHRPVQPELASGRG